MSDNDDATPPLGYSGVLSVQHSPGEAIPEVDQRPDDGTHCAAVRGDAPAGAGFLATGRQEARDVLEDDPTGRVASQEPGYVPVEAGSCALTHARATARHGEVLAWESGSENSSSGVGLGCVEVIGGQLAHVVV